MDVDILSSTNIYVYEECRTREQLQITERDTDMFRTRENDRIRVTILHLHLSNIFILFLPK